MTKLEDKKLLKLASIKCRENADNTCELCGKKDRTLNAHHFFGRKNRSTRYWLPNLIALCYSCHCGSIHSAHESPSWFEKEMLKIRGEFWLGDLSRRWSMLSKPGYYDVIDYLGGKVKEY